MTTRPFDGGWQQPDFLVTSRSCDATSRPNMTKQKAPASSTGLVAYLAEANLLADHLQIAGGNHHLATVLSDVAGQRHGVAHVRHELRIFLHCEIARHGVNFSFGREESHRLAPLRARNGAI